jgi:hypothetical protein
VVPSLEVVTQAVSATMHEHATQVFFFKVLLLSTVTQLVKNPSLSSLHESIEDKPDGLAAMLLGSSVLLALRNSELLPLLEERRNIKVPHSLNDLLKLLDASLLEQ